MQNFCIVRIFTGRTRRVFACRQFSWKVDFLLYRLSMVSASESTRTQSYEHHKVYDNFMKIDEIMKIMHDYDDVDYDD